MSRYLVAITTSLKRSMLEDVWDASPDGDGSLRDTLRQFEKAARKAIAGGSIRASSAPGRHVTLAGYGQGEISPTEVAEAWRELVDLFDERKRWLLDCSSHGLDPHEAEMQGIDPALQTAVSPFVFVDSTGNWPALIQTYGVNPDSVIGKPIGDEAVYVDMLYHLFPVTEARSDYSGRRIIGGMQYT